MKLYQTKPVDGFIQLQLKNFNEDNAAIELLAQSRTLASEWKCLEVYIITKGKKSDFPFLWAGKGMVVVSNDAKKELEEKWQDETIEFLPLSCDKEVYYLVHVIKPVDIAYMHTRVDGKSKMVFNEQEYLKNNLQQKGMFRAYLKGIRSFGEIILTDKFINFIQESSLKGFDCDVVWDSGEKYEESGE